MAYTRIVITTPLTATQDLANVRMNGTGSWHNVQRLLSWLAGFRNGSRRGNMRVGVGAVYASGTITFTSTGPADGQVCFINGIVVYAKTTVTEPTVEFARSNTPAVAAANLAAMINASASFNYYLSATSLLGVVTIKALNPGTIGNAFQCVNSDMANTTFSGSGKLAGGSEGTTYSLTLGQLIA